MESKMITPEVSHFGLYSARDPLEEGDHGDASALKKVKPLKDELGEEWRTLKIGNNGTRVPFAKKTKKTKSSPPSLAVKRPVQLEAPSPFECGVCFGPMLQATVVRCGHMFCKECILECKRWINSCPVCRGVLGKPIRVYDVDKVMDEYFTQLASEDTRHQYLEAKEKRIAGLVLDMASRKKRYFRRIREEWTLIRFRFRSKGIIRATVVTARRFFCFGNNMAPLPIPTKAWILFGLGLLFGILLDRFARGEESTSKFVNYWWNHILTGIYNYNKGTVIQPPPLPPPPPPPPPASQSIIFGSLRKLWSFG